MLQINQKIEQARLSANLSQEEMAEKLGIKRSTYQYWEKKTPSVDKVKLVAKVLGLDDDYFFGTSDEILVDRDEPAKAQRSDRISNEVLVSMAQSNRELVQSNKKLVDAHYDLVQMLKAATANAPSGRQRDTDLRLAVLQDYLVEFVAEKKKQSVEAINAELRNRELDLQKAIYEGSTQND